MFRSRPRHWAVVFAALTAAPALPAYAESRSWIGGTDNWDNPAAWSPAGVPGDGDLVLINTNGDVVNYVQPAAVSLGNIGLGASTGATLNQLQDTLTVSTMSIGGGNVTTGTYNYSGGVLNVGGITINTGGTVTGSADITIGTGLHFVGGAMSGSGQTIVPSGKVLNFLGPANAQLHRTITNYGTATWADTGSVSGSGTFINEATFNITNDGGPALSLPSFINRGTVTKVSGNATFFGGGTTFDNQGSVVVTSGKALFINGAVVQRSGTSLTGGSWTVAGELQMGGGSIETINSAATVILDGAASVLTPINALATNAGAFTVTGGREFTTAGAFSNTGQLTIGPDSTLTVTTSLAQQIGSTLTAGTYDVSGTLNLPGGPIVTNQANFRLGNGAVCTAIDTIVNNEGTFTLGFGRSFTAGAFNNSGTVLVESSANLILSNGGTQSGTFNVLATSGSVNFSGGTHTFNNPTLNTVGGPLSGSIIISSTATITSSSDWPIASSTIWSGGTITGDGSVLIPSGYHLRLLTGSSRSLTTTIENSGTVTWQSNNGVFGSGTFNNAADGLLQIMNTPGGQAFGITQFNNAGTIVKTAMGFMNTASNFGGVMTFNNTGTVDVQSGTLNINGAVTQATTSTLTGGTWITSSNLNLSAAPPITTIGPAATVQLNGAASSFNNIDTLANNQGSFTITNGRNFTTAGALANSGDLAIGPGSTLTLAGTLHDTGALTIDASAQIDLTDQKMVTTDALGVWDGFAYTGVTGLVQSNHITTTSDFAGLTTLAIASADDTNYVGGTFGGVSVNSGDVLLAYTLAGDVNLDLLVDADDYFNIDSNYNKPTNLLGYAKGDFNYDGVINGDDYLLIDASFSGQPGFPPSLALSAPAGVTAVPEPGSLASFMLITLAATASARPRRQR